MTTFQELIMYNILTSQISLKLIISARNARWLLVKNKAIKYFCLQITRNWSITPITCRYGYVYCIFSYTFLSMRLSRQNSCSVWVHIASTFAFVYQCFVYNQLLNS